TVTFASFALWFFGGVGNSFINAFQLYLPCNQRKSPFHCVSPPPKKSIPLQAVPCTIREYMALFELYRIFSLDSA
ncbi:hypothetical protein, partial [uncultured Oscillibacter sp.]|uniref:hypothetical protein n=1 Tax=uncultured Oscillibacter sp. TaxID=876091 RepID=UPI0025F41314